MTKKPAYQCPSCNGTKLAVQVSYEADLLQGGSFDPPRPSSLPRPGGCSSPYQLGTNNQVRCTECDHRGGLTAFVAKGKEK
jgi:hypothetical protein